MLERSPAAQGESMAAGLNPLNLESLHLAPAQRTPRAQGAIRLHTSIPLPFTHLPFGYCAFQGTKALVCTIQAEANPGMGCQEPPSELCRLLLQRLALQDFVPQSIDLWHENGRDIRG